MANELGLDINHLKLRFEGTLDESKTEWYQAQIDKAVRKLLAVCPLVKQKVEDGVLDLEFVADKVMDAALRVVRNPEGYTSESEGGYSYGLSGSTGSGYLRYYPEELEELGCGMTQAEQTMGTFRLRATPGWAFPGGTGW